jgi:two-component system, NtrC family, nitrogen regulation sensor histidine kinase GlnL
MVCSPLSQQLKPASHKKRYGAPAGVTWDQMLSNLDDGVVTVDLDGRIAFFNEAAEVLTETSSAATVGHTLEKIFKRELWLIDIVKKTRPPRQKSARGEGDFVTRWGGKTPVSVTASPLLNTQGRFLGTIMLLRDDTHRKVLEEDLKRNDRLVMMGTLAAGLAHEIKNPLGGIKGAAQLLRRGAREDPSVTEFTDIVIREVERVNKLIEQLLDLSRPGGLDLAPVNIHEILNHVLLLEGQSAEGTAIQVRKRFDPSLPPVRADRAQLIQVFLNLVKNAFQAMGRSGVLTITTRLETDFRVRDQSKTANRFLWVDITDEGAGIREADLPQIFSPFFTTKTNGTGLGLAICYRIIKEHGGTIRVESTEGQGSTFKVSLMVAD